MGGETVPKENKCVDIPFETLILFVLSGFILGRAIKNYELALSIIIGFVGLVCVVRPILEKLEGIRLLLKEILEKERR